ncbi:DUF4334 domain-containing protein [Lutibaculum baratangense]|uniref:DUF4334 domain-containing protein n=1 Tax=Lutibaculum baratangense AMV1 TaxID=631454 RepID=V4RDF5_9HYPH|nr:DUF4334 domain-containing protein [Lutibaculum baratangense]ESR23384.1 hypothetical protein N177_3452 [Lutibaculum baratangense AMV1]
MTPRAPDWLCRWREAPLSPEEGLALFDALPGVPIASAIGRWRGAGLGSGNRLDGLLEAFGWHGKDLRTEDDVAPLLFRSFGGGIRTVDPARLPLGLALRLLPVLRNPLAPRLFRLSLPLLATSAPAARVRVVEHRAVASAAMIYDRQPIIDHFRLIDRDRMLGLMDLRGVPEPFFFLLEREA